MRALFVALPLLAAGCVFDRAGFGPWPLGGDAAGEAGTADLTWPEDGPGNDASSIADATADSGPAAWPLRKKITVDAAMVTGQLLDFPLLVALQQDSELAAGARSDGKDILFRSLDGTQQYDHEIEHYDGSTGALVAWVKLPSLGDSANTELYMYYGNPAPPAPPPPNKVWSSGYAGVWHLGGATVSDSGPSNLVATVNGGVSAVAGKLGQGRTFDTQPTSWIELGDGALQGNSPFTLELWFRPASSQADWIGLATKGRSSDAQWIGLYLKPDKLLSVGWSWQTPGQGNLDSKGVKPGPGVWHHAAVTFDGSDARLYYNGTQDANSPASNAYSTISQPLVLGTDRFDNNPSFDGVIDEVRLSTVERSAGWIATQHANQADPTQYVTVGPQESL